MHYRTPQTLSYFSDSFSSGFSPLYSLVYGSEGAPVLTPAVIEEIVTAARHKNDELGISGILVAYEGKFLQALEGTEELVRMLFARIEQDPRHHNISVLLEEYIPERNFSEWAMGYYLLGAEEAATVAGFTGALDPEGFLPYFQRAPQKAMELLLRLSQSL